MEWIYASKSIYTAYLQTGEEKFQARKRIFESMPNVVLGRPWYSNSLHQKCEEQNGLDGFPMPTLSKDMQVYFQMTSPKLSGADNNLDGSSHQNSDDNKDNESPHSNDDDKTRTLKAHSVAAHQLISGRCCWLHAAAPTPAADGGDHHHNHQTTTCPSTVMKRTPLELNFPNGVVGPMRRGPEREFAFRSLQNQALPKTGSENEVENEVEVEVEGQQVEIEVGLEFALSVIGYSDRRRALGKHVPQRLELKKVVVIDGDEYMQIEEEIRETIMGANTI